MRRWILLLACSTLLAADGGDLRPRYGDGFAGLGVGSFVRMKLTAVMPNRAPTVIITTSTLKKVEKDALTIERESRNPLTEPSTVTSKVPPSGNAGADEAEQVKKLDDETIEAAGKKWPCTKRVHTITRKDGSKRVITEWIAKKPLLRVKRMERRYGPDGKAASTSSMLLSKLPQEREVAGKKVTCIGYRTIEKAGETEQRMETWSSRGVPGDLAGGEFEVYMKGKKVRTLHLKVLAFEVK